MEPRGKTLVLTWGPSVLLFEPGFLTDLESDDE